MLNYGQVCAFAVNSTGYYSNSSNCRVDTKKLWVHIQIFKSKNKLSHMHTVKKHKYLTCKALLFGVSSKTDFVSLFLTDNHIVWFPMLDILTDKV